MQILSIWLEELKIFFPANLKNLVLGIARQLGSTFRFLFVDWWWLSVIVLLSNLLLHRIVQIIESESVLYLAQAIFFAAKVYFAFLAALFTFPSRADKSSAYIAARQHLFWPIVTPFVLWIYLAPHLYRFFGLIAGRPIMFEVVNYASWAFLLQADWFASPLFVFFAFIIIDTYSMYGVWHGLEHAASMLWYSYPVCVIMFAVLYGLHILLDYGLAMLAPLDVRLALLINPIAILIPVGVVLFGAVYQWHMKLVDELSD